MPAITNADASGSGTAIIALTVDEGQRRHHHVGDGEHPDHVSGFPAGTTFTDAHIHNGAAGSNAGIFVSAALAAGDLTLTNGSGSVTKNGISVPADRAAAILANPAGHYFNVHTALNPAGAIRGQLAGGGAILDPGVSVPY